MKNKTPFVIVGLALVFSILACSLNVGGDWEGIDTVRGSGSVVEEGREVGDITKVELSMQGTLHIVMGSREELRIEAEDNLLEYIQTDVQAGRLVIETRPGISLENTRPIEFYLTVDELDVIETSSSGDVETSDLQSGAFSASISSSGNIFITSLDCTSLRVDVSSSGNVTIPNLLADSISVDISSSGKVEVVAGEVQQQDITISSSGDYRADDLASLEAQVTLNSSGSATIRVSDRLTGRLSSSGSIYYIGDPEVSVSTSSSGDAVQVDD